MRQQLDCIRRGGSLIKTTRHLASIVFLSLLILCGSCSKKEVSDANKTDARGLPAAVDRVLPKGYGTQDFLIHLDLQVLKGSTKEGRSFYQHVLKRAQDGAGEVKALSGGFQFRPSNSISAIVRDKSGRVLPSISVNFGLLSAQAGQGQRLLQQLRDRLPPGVEVTGEDVERASLLVEVTTADLSKTPVNVQTGDISDVDLTFVEEIDVGDHLRSLYIFGQTYPPADPTTEATLTPEQIFVSRWAADRVAILGIPERRVAVTVDEGIEVVHGSKIMRHEAKPFNIARNAFKVLTGCTWGIGAGGLVGLPTVVGAIPGAIVGCAAGGTAKLIFEPVIVMQNAVEYPCVPIKGGGTVVIKEGGAHMEITDEPCGRATGDIHMETFDGQRYDLQAAGEFVALRDTGGQVTVQIRLQPSNGSRRVSVATAVAARVDGAKVAIHLKPQPQLYVNDQAINLERGSGMSLGTAGGITFTGTSWVIAWPDGTTGQIKQNGGHFDLLVGPGAPAGKLKGLFGNADGKLEGELVARDGFVVPAEMSSEHLYGRFAESWRISQDESLFHYAQGESTATYTDRGFPYERATLSSLDATARDEAERQCRAAGITAPGPLAECIVDLAITGDRAFLFSAALAQAVSRDSIASPSAAAPAAPQAGTIMVSGIGKDGYVVYDSTGKHRLTLERLTNAGTELLPGTYVVGLNASRQRVMVTTGQQTILQAGNLMVSGTGKDGYVVYDSTGKERLTLERPTNSGTELLPGTYVVGLNASRQRVAVAPGQQAIVQPGILMVSGTGNDGYVVYDSTGSTRLTLERPTNSGTELLPGTYVVGLNASRKRVPVGPAQQALIRAGTVTVSGTGRDGYLVYDSTGKNRLTLERPTNSGTEILPGSYTVMLNASRQRVAVAPGQQVLIQAGTLMLSGTGVDGYVVYDSTGRNRLTLERPATSVTELLPGTYIVKVGQRSFTVSVTAGQRATAGP